MENSIRLPGPISLALLLAYGGVDPSALASKTPADEESDPANTEIDTLR